MESHEQAKRRLKQKYLHDQIIGNSMDPEAFSQFLSERRDNGYIIRH